VLYVVETTSPELEHVLGDILILNFEKRLLISFEFHAPRILGPKEQEIRTSLLKRSPSRSNVMVQRQRWKLCAADEKGRRRGAFFNRCQEF
jgi:hypothetical protein